MKSRHNLPSHLVRKQNLSNRHVASIIDCRKILISTLHICSFDELDMCAVSKRHLEACQFKVYFSLLFQLLVCLTYICFSRTCSKQFFSVRVTVCGLRSLQNFKNVCRYLAIGVVYHGTPRRNKLKLHFFFCITAGFKTCSTHYLILYVNY